MPTEWYLACLTPLVVYRGINQVTTGGGDWGAGGGGLGGGDWGGGGGLGRGGGGTSGLHGPGTE